MNGDMPSMTSIAYGSDTRVFGLNAAGGLAIGALGGIAGGGRNQDALYAAMKQQANFPVEQMQKPKEPPMASRRLVKVVIVDPNENVPLEDCVLYSGEEKLTDATDQELFFEIDIKGILEAHNAKRVKVVDKKVKERTEHLEPAKIRDLKMVVVNVATF
jgi:hypothetical protein